MAILSSIAALSKRVDFGKKILGTLRSFMKNDRLPKGERGVSLPEKEGLVKSPHLLKEPVHALNQLLQHYKEELQRLADRGGVEGAKGLPRVEEVPGSTEREIIQAAGKARQELDHHNAVVMLALERKIQEAKSGLEEPPDKEKLLQELKPKKRQLLVAANLYSPTQQTVAAKIAELEEENRQLEERLDDCNAEHHQLLTTDYGGIPPRRHWYHRRGIFISLLVMLFIVEIQVNFYSFMSQGFGDTNLTALLLGFFFAALQGYSAERLGFAWQNGQKIHIWISLGFTILFCLLMSAFRLSMDISFFIKMVYLLINFIIAAIAVYATSLYYQHRHYFAVAEERAQIPKKIVTITQQIETIKQDHEDRCTAIKLGIEQEAEQKVSHEAQRLQELKIDADHALKMWKTHYEAGLDEIERAKKKALEQYRFTNQQVRKKYRHPVITQWQGSGNHSTDSTLLNGIAGLLLVCCLTFSITGCSSDVFPANTIEIILDKTDGNNVDIDHHALADYICQLALADGKKDSWGAVTVNFSEIGETSNIQAVSIHLSASEGFWQRQEITHQIALDQFHGSIVRMLDSLNQPGPETDFSFIHRNIYHRLKWLGQQPGKRYLLCFSDLILNTPEVNFYHYQDHPEMLHRHQESVFRRMIENYTLDGLPEITLINIYQADKHHDGLHEAAKRFFGYYWISLGIDVEFLTGLPLSFPVSKHKKITSHFQETETSLSNTHNN
ncbi:MAG: hypothetical protein MI974_12820 [Chitinophagales bacterium]|nr:hypothetical protein [Chitinophagales bacterium]